MHHTSVCALHWPFPLPRLRRSLGFTNYSLCETYRQGSSEISFIHLNIEDLFNKHLLFTGESTPLSINTLLTSLNHSLIRICYQISRDQVDHRVSSKLISRVGHQQERRYLLAPKRSPDLPVMTPERSDEEFFSRNDSTISKVY